MPSTQCTCAVPLVAVLQRVKIYNGLCERCASKAAGNGKNIQESHRLGPVTHRASSDFVQAIYDEIHTGYGFTPLLGAGFSVSAGIPIINQLLPYLRRCICVALGVEHDELVNNDTRQLWNPRTDRWPPLIDRRKADADWIGLMQEALKREDPSQPVYSVYQEALGAMAEWRSALFFLSRLVFDRPRRREPNGILGYKGVLLKPRLGQPSQSVIDAGWREWMRDKQPSLNHKLLATLSALLRIDLIMTTNFDDLIERAFEASKNPLQTFDVSLLDGLPELAVVSRGRSIIKMHGSVRSLRADYSLDGEPSAEDRRLFAEYLAGQRLDGRTHTAYNDAWTQTTRKHLLVIGVGATEVRTMAYITESLRRLEDVKIFWVCYTDSDVLAVLDYAETLTHSERRGIDGGSRIHVLRHTDVALLMLHIYQQIRKTIPPYNAIYPATAQLAVPPLPPEDPIWDAPGKEKQQAEVYERKANREKHIQKFQEDLIRHIKGEANDIRKPPGNPICVATSVKHVLGVTIACERVFRQLEAEYVCLWIELTDIFSIDELFEVIQETAYFKLGQRDWTPLYASDDHRPRNLEISRIADASSKPFLIFINARETPGSNRNFDNEDANGWLDKYEEWQSFARLLSELENASGGRFKVVVLAYDASSPLVTRPELFVANVILLDGTPTDSTEKTIKEVMKWVAIDPATSKRRKKNEQWAALRFLHTLAMMQRSRHLAITWSRCAWQLGEASSPQTKEQEQTRDRYWSPLDEKKPDWLKDLEKLGILRRKDGGFIWMHADLRKELRKELVCANDAPRGLHLGCEARAEIQQQIAGWYLKLFDATNSPAAIFEAVDHLCSSAAHLIVGTVKQSPNAEAIKKNLKIAKRRVDTAKQLLDEHSFLIFSQGYPRACTRRLDKISSFWEETQWMAQGLKGGKATRTILELLNTNTERKAKREDPQETRALMIAISRLRCTTLEINTMIAREIGEDKAAYRAMQDLAGQMQGSPDAFRKSLNSDRQENAREQRNRLKGHRRVWLSLMRREKQTEAVRAWLQWWLRCGLLGIASRSFKEAEKSLYRAVYIAAHGKLETPQIKTLKGRDYKSVDKCCKDMDPAAWDEILGKLKFDYVPEIAPKKEIVSNDAQSGGNGRRRSDPYIRYGPGIYALQEAAYLLILRAGAEFRYETLLSSSPDEEMQKQAIGCKKEAENHLKLAERIALKGLVLIEQIQDSGVDREDHDRHLMGNKSRLLQLAGLACRYDLKRKPSSRHAMSMMGDAVAALNEAEPLFASAEHAIIDLRRAEVRLTEAANIDIFEKEVFGTWTLDRLRGEGINTPLNQTHYVNGERRTRQISQFKVARELRERWRKDGADQRNRRETLSECDDQLSKEEVEHAEEVMNLVRFTFQKSEIDQIDSDGKNCERIDKQVCYASLNSQFQMNRKKRAAIDKNIKSMNAKIKAEELNLLISEIARSSSTREPGSEIPLRRNLAEVASRASDAIRFLDRAEPILRERRRNVNWTTYYFELRLRAIALILWSSIVYEGTPIPYLGLESAMRLTETEPDQLLRDAGRMIRVDSYRMARIILAYASCARALEIRLALDRAAVRLPERLKQMHDNLDQAVRQLREVIVRRTKPTVSEKDGKNHPEYKAAVTPVVTKVVEEILDRVSRVVTGLTASIQEQITEEEIIKDPTSHTPVTTQGPDGAAGNRDKSEPLRLREEVLAESGLDA